jgi:hypothetical protein
MEAVTMVLREVEESGEAVEAHEELESRVMMVVMLVREGVMVAEDSVRRGGGQWRWRRCGRRRWRRRKRDSDPIRDGSVLGNGNVSSHRKRKAQVGALA